MCKSKLGTCTQNMHLYIKRVKDSMQSKIDNTPNKQKKIKIIIIIPNDTYVRILLKIPTLNPLCSLWDDFI